MKKNYTQKINVLITSLFIFLFAAFVIANTENKVVFLDTDQDGLSDEEETLYGTDPTKSDTDGDGYSDGTEIKSGFDPLKPAPNDQLAVNSKPDNARPSDSDNPSPILSNFAIETKKFIDSKNNEPVTQEDIQKFVNENLKDIIADEELSLIDYSKVNVKKQNFDGLNEFEALVKEKDDWDKYITYIFSGLIFEQTNEEILTSENIKTGLVVYADKYKTLSTSSPDYDFFRELLPSIKDFIDYGKEGLEVPENVLPIHIKLLSLLQGYVDLNNPELPKIEEDVLVKMTILSRTENLNKILLELINKDIMQYNSKFDKIK